MGSIGGVPFVFANVAHLGLGIPPREVKLWWRALWKARDTEVQRLRRAVLQFEYKIGPHGDDATWIAAILQPFQLIRTLDTLVDEGLLTRPQATRLQEYILTCVDSTGVWR